MTKVVPDLLTAAAIAEDPADFIRRHARVLTQFDHHTQDSGNVSWLVEAGAERLFVKTAGRDPPAVAGAPAPYFDHPGRVALLRNAIDLAGTFHHPALAPLLNVIESPAGPMLVYEAATGSESASPGPSATIPALRTAASPLSRPKAFSRSSTC